MQRIAKQTSCGWRDFRMRLCVVIGELCSELFAEFASLQAACLKQVEAHTIRSLGENQNKELKQYSSFSITNTNPSFILLVFSPSQGKIKPTTTVLVDQIVYRQW